MRIESHSGPLPDPTTLERYEAVAPGAAERIIVMAEQQSAHRMRLESQALTAEIARSSAGMWFAGLLAFFGLAAGTTMVLTGHEDYGVLVIVGDAVTMVGAFIYGTERRRSERREKFQQLVGGETDNGR